MYLTFVDGEFRGTAYFPESIATPAGYAWRETNRERVEADEKNPYAHQYVVVELAESEGAPKGVLAIKELAHGKSGSS
jgi:hypothetical protein